MAYTRTPTSDLIRRLGQALYGEHFDADLANALGIAKRSVRHWRNGENEPQPGVWGELAELVAERRETLAGLAEELAQRVAAEPESVK